MCYLENNDFLLDSFWENQGKQTRGNQRRGQVFRQKKKLEFFFVVLLISLYFYVLVINISIFIWTTININNKLSSQSVTLLNKHLKHSTLFFLMFVEILFFQLLFLCDSTFYVLVIEKMIFFSLWNHMYVKFFDLWTFSVLIFLYVVYLVMLLPQQYWCYSSFRFLLNNILFMWK